MLTIPWTSTKIVPDATTLVQVSRLELARYRDVPGFLIAALRIRRIALRTRGSIGVSLRAEPLRRTFWTLSAWQNDAAITDFVTSEEHRSVMTRYRDRMADSHFHTWNYVDPTEQRPTWIGAMKRYEASSRS